MDEFMNELSITPAERARKIASLILRRLNEGETQAAVAVAIGVSPATVNRLATDHIANFSAMLAHLGLKVVDSGSVCVDAATYAFLTQAHQRVMNKAPQLIWDAHE